MSDLVERLRIPGVDSQVLTAAAEMDEAEKANPEWLWYNGNGAVAVSFGRWAKVEDQAPYIRADLVIAALSLIEAERDKLREVIDAYRAAVTDCLREGGVVISKVGTTNSWWDSIIAAQQKAGSIYPPQARAALHPTEADHG